MLDRETVPLSHQYPNSPWHGRPSRFPGHPPHTRIMYRDSDSSIQSSIEVGALSLAVTLVARGFGPMVPAHKERACMNEKGG